MQLFWVAAYAGEEQQSREDMIVCASSPDRAYELAVTSPYWRYSKARDCDKVYVYRIPPVQPTEGVMLWCDDWPHGAQVVLTINPKNPLG